MNSTDSDDNVTLTKSCRVVRLFRKQRRRRRGDGGEDEEKGLAN